jgi:hypothetical protein
LRGGRDFQAGILAGGLKFGNAREFPGEASPLVPADAGAYSGKIEFPPSLIRVILP